MSKPRGGHLSLTPATARRATALPAVEFQIWAGVAFACRNGAADLPRRWVLDRAGLEVTPDRLKKLPGRLRSIENAGLWSVAFVNDRVQVRLTHIPADGRWCSLLTRADFDRAVDPADPLSVGTLQAWVCRWLPVLRHDRVEVSQADLAACWRVDRATVRREAARLREAGLLAVRKRGGVSVLSVATLGLTDADPIRQLGPAGQVPTIRQSDKSGTSKATNPAPARAGASSTRARSLRPHALDPSGSARTCRSDSNRARDSQPVACGHGTGKPKQPDQAIRSGWQVIDSVRWLAIAPERVRHQLARMLARRLRTGGPPGYRDVWTQATLTRALADADPGEPTNEHARIARAALAGLVADRKAGPLVHASTAPMPQHPDDDADPDEIRALAVASLAAVTPTKPAANRGDELRRLYLELAEAGPPADPAEVAGFLTGVLLSNAERTGQPITATAARLRGRIEPRHADDLDHAAATAAMITNARIQDRPAAAHNLTQHALT